MSRRWRGARATLAVVDETTAAAPEQAAPVQTGAAADELAAAREAEQRQRERANRLEELYDVQIRRADDLERDLLRATFHLEEKDQNIKTLERRIAQADESHTAVCVHAAAVRELRVQLAAMQTRVDQLQAANEAHDRWARRAVTT